MKPFAEKFYGSTQWHNCRDSFIAKRIAIDGGLCQRCHEIPGYIIHHTIELTPSNISDPDISLNHERLEYVCLECHNKIHERFISTARFSFDEDGNVLPPEGYPPFVI